MSVASEAMSEDDGAFHPHFASGGDITLCATDGTKFRTTLSTLQSYSAPSSALHHMADLPPAASSNDQFVPFTHARGPTLAFLLDCIAAAEKRKAAGILPPPEGPAPTTAIGEDEDEADDSDTDDDDDGATDVVIQTPPLSDGNPLSPPPAPLPPKGPAKTAPAYSGLPSGRQQRNRAKAAIFQGVPKLPRLCQTAESIERSKTLLPTQPAEEDEWGSPNWEPTPWGEDAGSAASDGGEDNDHASSNSDSEGGKESSSSNSEGGTEENSNASKTCTPRAASPAPSTAQSTTSFATAVTAPSTTQTTTSFATAVTGVTPMVVDDTFETESEATATATLQPELHAPTFEEVLDVMNNFELDSLKYVVFDALKLSRATHLADNAQPTPALSAEYLYAFSCKYKIGNKSYWATRCLASAWRKGLIPGAEPLARPRVRFNDLDGYPLRLLEKSDIDALKDMFGRFNRTLSVFASNFTGTPRSDTNTRFGRACKTCPIKTEHGTWQEFKRALLREHVAPLVITAPQFMRKRHFLTDTLRQFIACTRCADRIIHMCLNLWKRVQPDAWSFNPRKRGRKARFARKPKVHHVWNTAGTQAHHGQHHQAQQQAAALANAGVTTTTTATGGVHTTTWHIPAALAGTGPVHIQLWGSAPLTNTTATTSNTTATMPAPAAPPTAPVAPAATAVPAAPANPPAPAAPSAPATTAPTAPATAAPAWNAPASTNFGWAPPAPPPAPASAPPATNAAGSGWGNHNSGWGNSSSTGGWGNSGWGSHTSTAHAAHASSGWGASSASAWGSATNSSNAATGSSNTATGSNTYQGWGAPAAGSSNAQNDGW